MSGAGKEALEDGKTVFMAVPRLRAERCFIELDPARLRGRLAEAATRTWSGRWRAPPAS